MKAGILARLSLTAALTLGLARLASAQEPVCGPEVKEEIAKILIEHKADGPYPSQDALELQQKLYDKYSYCAQPHLPQPGPIIIRPPLIIQQTCGKQTYAGSLFYERMPCCGYDPQKKLFACPVEVRKPFGFGAAPFPGSREFVMNCVDFNNTGVFVEVATDSVHLANTTLDLPPWYFAVTAQAQLWNKPHTELSARSILSWGLRPRDCNYRPIWGNVLEYKIRLDP